MSKNPYNNFPSSSYWKPSVSEKSCFDINGIWQPKYEINEKDKFATYGSCFAQHFSNALRQKGIKWIDAEQCPKWISNAVKKEFNYGIYSSRTQNIYTPTMLLQWLKISYDKTFKDIEIWEENNIFYDPLRPTLEPDGFISEKELINSRKVTCNSFIQSIKEATIFVYTLGLTERWINNKSGIEYANCPGTTKGFFNSKIHEPNNLLITDIQKALDESFHIIRLINPMIKIMLTVSPVPLVATFQDKHVLTATIEAKSNLRSAASLFSQSDYIDYFPSYEIISSFPYKGIFYDQNLRTVNPAGVNHVMKLFFEGAKIINNDNPSGNNSSEVVCEEEILESFQK